MPRFVILRHDTPPGRPRGLHWDLMLQIGDVLRTWALAEEPEPGKIIPAELLPDHRLAYLDYEGPVSQDRGTVQRWDRGEYVTLEESPDRLTIAITGGVVRGKIVLEADADRAGDAWRFHWIDHAGAASS